MFKFSLKLMHLSFFILLTSCSLTNKELNKQTSNQPLIPLTITKVTNNVYSALGATAAPSYENAGHNNNLSFVITNDGVLVINGGDNYYLAQSLHYEIKKLTNQKVKLVVNENGQGHAFLGNSYWRKQNVAIIAHEDAVEEIKQHGRQSLEQMQARNKEKSEHTVIVIPEQSFKDKKLIQMGDTQIELISFGGAHSPGDISVWLPQQKLIITGDMAFHERLLGVFPYTVTADWVDSFNKMLELPIEFVIPGHGSPTSIETITKYTRDYLIYLREASAEIIENDGDMNDAYDIDQSDYSHLHVFDILAKKNAGRIFREVEEASF